MWREVSVKRECKIYLKRCLETQVKSEAIIRALSSSKERKSVANFLMSSLGNLPHQ